MSALALSSFDPIEPAFHQAKLPRAQLMTLLSEQQAHTLKAEKTTTRLNALRFEITCQSIKKPPYVYNVYTI